MCVCVCVHAFILVQGVAFDTPPSHSNTKMHPTENNSVLAFVFVLFFFNSCAIKSFCCLVCSHPHFSVCPPLKHPNSPRPYASVPIDMTRCPFLSRSLLGQAWMLMCVIVQLVVCIWLQEQLFVLGGFGMRGCGSGSNPMSHCSNLVYFCGGLVVAGMTGLKVC